MQQMNLENSSSMTAYRNSWLEEKKLISLYFNGCAFFDYLKLVIWPPLLKTHLNHLNQHKKDTGVGLEKGHNDGQRVGAPLL